MARREMPDTTDPVLTLRIALDSPSTGTTVTVGSQLDAAGFKVGSTSARGLEVEGTRSQIEQFFNTRIDFVKDTPQFKGEPLFDRLPEGGGYRAYFPARPTYFP
jgi:hypothetical protein